MKKLDIGDTVEIDEKHRPHINTIKGKMDNAMCLMNTGAAAFRSSEKELWDFIHFVIPETEGISMNLNHENHTINITGKP
ncbi:MAG: hypothetical protein KAT14_07810 [Candidatus Marinimicrobia bacterium]|nr:hypothetical protein [Candidatus Neomarinimicrobiota bacterium]